MERGRYIVIEGTDGSGKSTVADMLACQFREEGREVIRVDEPSSAINEKSEILVPMADKIGEIVRNKNLGRLALTNFLLFHAQRVENWKSASEPALEAGVDVISARNYWSTVVYQGYGEGFDIDRILSMTELDLGEKYMNPDSTYILDMKSEEKRQKRISDRGELESHDYFESKDGGFQDRLLQGYRNIAQENDIRLIHTDSINPRTLAINIFRDIVKKHNTSHPFYD